MKQKRVQEDAFFSAGRGGFEPPVDTRPTTVFETVPFNHSGTFPIVRAVLYPRFQCLNAAPDSKLRASLADLIFQ